MEKKQVKLLEPITVGGEEVTEISIRRSTVGDEEDAMEMAIRLKRPKNSVTVEVCMFSKLTRLPEDAIRSLYGPDYTALREALNELNAPEGEDPTMTPETDGMPEKNLED